MRAGSVKLLPVPLPCPYTPLCSLAAASLVTSKQALSVAGRAGVCICTHMWSCICTACQHMTHSDGYLLGCPSCSIPALPVPLSHLLPICFELMNSSIPPTTLMSTSYQFSAIPDLSVPQPARCCKAPLLAISRLITRASLVL